MLFKASGASGISKKQPLQLIARNCRAGSHACCAQHPDLHGKLWPPALRRRKHGDIGQRARTCRLTFAQGTRMASAHFGYLIRPFGSEACAILAALYR